MAAPADADSILFERLRQALAPDHQLKREIARGGMGIVYLAHDIALDRPVAIKLLMPEYATAPLAARFLREAQVLAKLRHPHIVTIHQVSEKAGLYYYIMEWLEGETLKARLARQPLNPKEAIQLGAELLDALSAAHQEGWVHRDVKPGNIFLTEGHGILTDFGIARPLTDDATTLTQDQRTIGTPAYMSPEQREGRPVTEASDIYSAGSVLYEAITGRRWWRQDHQPPDWSGVPAGLRGVLRKAMRPVPSDRWRGADQFRHALIKARRPGVRTAVAAAAFLLLVAALFAVLGPESAEVTGRDIRLQSFQSTGSAGLGDSIEAAIGTSLASFPDLMVSGPFERGSPQLRAGLVLTGSVEGRGGQLRVTIRSRPGESRQISVTREGDSTRWRDLADSLAAQLIYAIYQSDTTQDPSLPTAALPRTPAGWRAWSQAEPLFTQARWGEAAVAYRQAEALDSTCLLCAFRINDIDRWLDQSHDPARLDRLLAHAERFPGHYRLLIQAASSSGPERLALMDSAARTRDFFLAFFHRGDELFHRGPLVGRHRSEALADFERVVQLRPDFAPGWEHLAWLRIAEGDSAGAAGAMDSLARTGTVVDQTALGLRFLLRAAFAYRFGTAGSGDAIVNDALTIPAIASFPDLAMGPRLMLTFDAPDAAISMGRIFARRSPVALVRSGLLAQALGHLARGYPDSALHYARILQSRVPGTDADLFLAQLAGTLALVDGDSSPDQGRKIEMAREYLQSIAQSDAAGNDARQRAAWLVALLVQRTPSSPAGAGRTKRPTGSPEARLYLALIEADLMASRGRFDQALTLTDWSGEDLVGLPDPFFSTVTHLLRADWFARAGKIRDAMATLLWHEASDFGSYPVGDLDPSEIAQAFGTVARWNRARLLDVNRPLGLDPCPGYRAVVRLWSAGDSVHRARAALATDRLTRFSCGGG